MKKIILITGSTDGIGKLAAMMLAKAGHRLYLHGRNADKLTEVISELKTQTNNNSIDGFVADFSELTEVQKMSKDINEKLTKIDVLINNAGVFKSPNPLTKEGIDIRIVVNYFAPYLLTYNIMDKLRLSAEAKIINLSSAAQSRVSSDLLEGSITVSDQEAYAQSKLAILMWSFYLAKQEPRVAVVALNPGSLLNTNMVREAYGKFWSSADKGADIICDLAVVKNCADIDGQYYDNDRGSFGEAHPDAYDEDLIAALIDKTEYALKAWQ